jgi:2-haloalkanoic acid dehalogenase type II
MARDGSRYDAVVFDLLTALLDSWTLWNSVAGSAQNGLRWRQAYLDLTYQTGAYRPYETLVQEAAERTQVGVACADNLIGRWNELEPWPETREVVAELARHVPLGIATNCSQTLGLVAARRAGGPFAVVVTAESAGFYKPRPEPYQAVLAQLGAAPARTLFVAGSSADVPGAKGVGMPVFWHNRLRLKPRDDARPDFEEASLHPLLELV